MASAKVDTDGFTDPMFSAWEGLHRIRWHWKHVMRVSPENPSLFSYDKVVVHPAPCPLVNTSLFHAAPPSTPPDVPVSIGLLFSSSVVLWFNRSVFYSLHSPPHPCVVMQTCSLDPPSPTHTRMHIFARVHTLVRTHICTRTHTRTLIQILRHGQAKSHRGVRYPVGNTKCGAWLQH